MTSRQIMMRRSNLFSAGFWRVCVRKPLAGCRQIRALLEVGAGTGLNFVFYPPKTEGVAADPSSEMLKIAAGQGQAPGREVGPKLR